jgi:hypothetical protein
MDMQITANLDKIKDDSMRVTIANDDTGSSSSAAAAAADDGERKPRKVRRACIKCDDDARRARANV